MKLQNSKVKEKILKTAKGKKKQIIIKETAVRPTANFLTQTVEANKL